MRARSIVMFAILMGVVLFGAYCLFQVQVGVNSLIGDYCVTWRSFRLYRFNVENSPDVKMNEEWIRCVAQDPSAWLLPILVSEIIAVSCAYLWGRYRNAEKKVGRSDRT